MAKNQWFDDLSGEQLQDYEQRRRKYQHLPARAYRRRENEREYGRYQCTDIRYKSHNHRDQTPKRSRRHTDEFKAYAYCKAEHGVECDLGKKELAQTLAGVVQGGGCPLNIRGAGQSDEPISQVFPLKEDKDYKDHDDPCRR